MLLTVIILSILLVVGGITIFLLFQAGIRQTEENDLLQDWIREFKIDINKTFQQIKELDNKNIFEKDDEVGVVFQEMIDLIKKVNDRTQEEEE